jgi:hypothetical protein
MRALLIDINVVSELIRLRPACKVAPESVPRKGNELPGGPICDWMTWLCSPEPS